MGKYKWVPHQFTVGEALDITEIMDLRDEMQEWVDNMSGTALENTERYQMAEEALYELENADQIDFEQIWSPITEDCGFTADELKNLKFTCSLSEPRSKRQSCSRAHRLSNCLIHNLAALDTLEDHLEGLKETEGVRTEIVEEVLKAIGSIRDQLEELEGIEFPGMFG